MRTMELPLMLQRLRQAGLWDHFFEFVTADKWTSLAADGGSSVALDADWVGGGVTLTTGATDNNECALRSTVEAFKFVANQPIVFAARATWAEANTDDLNIMFGLMDAIGANAMLDNGAGPKASFSGAVIYKADGDTLWSVRSSIGSTYTDTETSQACHAASTTVTLAIYCMPRSSTEIDIVYYMDPTGGADIKPLTDARGNVIKHTVTLGSPTEMNCGAYVKAGDTNSEVVTVDMLGAEQVLF